MYLGRVLGSVVCSVKDENLKSIKLLVVQKIENGKPGGLIVSADGTRQAGVNDLVYLIGSKEAGLPFPEIDRIPVDSTIIGFVDKVNEKN